MSYSRYWELSADAPLTSPGTSAAAQCPAPVREKVQALREAEQELSSVEICQIQSPVNQIDRSGSGSGHQSVSKEPFFPLYCCLDPKGFCCFSAP